METSKDSQDNEVTVQDRKIMWKQLKQQKKDAKKSKREQEFLANLRKPKDTKVVLADKSFVEKFRNQNVSSSVNRAPGFLAKDFPALSSTFSLPKPSSKSKEPMGYSKAVNNSVADLYFPSIEETTEKRVEKQNDCKDVSSTEDNVAVTDNTSPEPKVDAGDAEQISLVSSAPAALKKRTKRKDPVILYPDDFISNISPKNNALVHGSKRRRKPEKGVLCGNMLDSSNPIRKRGKHREIKKLKFSKLKFAVLRERILKQKERNNSSVEGIMGRKQLLIEIDEYLSNMTKSKLELAEKHQERCEENKTEEDIPEEKTPVESKSKEKKVKKKRPKYRKYCDNSYSEDLDASVRNLVSRIVHLQDRAFDKDAIKAKAKQKHVVGFREVKKFLSLKKIKMVVVAPDLEAKDAIYDMVEDIKKTASQQSVPCVFALSRRMLGFTAKKPVPVSAFGILNYDGLEGTFAEVKENLKVAQDKHNADNFKAGNTDTDLEVKKIEDNNSSQKVNVETEHKLSSNINKKRAKSKKKVIR